MTQTTQDIPDYIAELLDGDDLEDQTQIKAFENELPEAGETPARFVGYVELGTHPRKAYRGESKDPAPAVRLSFELLSAKKHVKEIMVDGVKKTIAPRIHVEWNKVIHDKSKFYKLLTKMQTAVPAKATKTHLAAFLNSPVKLNVIHKTVGEGAAAKTYANIDFDSISEALGMTQDGETVKLTVRPAVAPIQLFLWDKPTKASWDSLFIDGERVVKDEAGNEKTVSRNWIQAKLVSALDFQGSKLEAMLEAGDMPDITAVSDERSVEAPDEDPTDTKTASAATKAKPKTDKKAADAMADLGLI